MYLSGSDCRGRAASRLQVYVMRSMLPLQETYTAASSRQTMSFLGGNAQHSPDAQRNLAPQAADQPTLLPPVAVDPCGLI